MSLPALEQLLSQNHVVVFTTYRKDGRPQMTLVTAGAYDGGLAFTTRQRNAKYHNLMRDPRCAIGAHNTDADKLRTALRDVYRSAAGKDHPDWDEYDQAMAEQQRVVVLLRPGRIVLNNAR
jgi:hypothetical protein